MTNYYAQLKLVIAFLNPLSIAFALAVTIMACNNKHQNYILPQHYIPSTSEIVIRVNTINDFFKAFENHPILSHLNFDALKSAMKVVKNQKPKRSFYIAFLKNKDVDYNYLVIFDENNTDVLNNNKDVIKTILLNKDKIYQKSVASTTLLSDSKDLLESVSHNKSSIIQNLLKTSDNTNIGTLLFKTNNSYFKPLLFNSNFSAEDNYAVLDIDVSQSDFLYNGLIKFIDSTRKTIKPFKTNNPQLLKIQNVAPSNTNNFFCVTYSDASFLLKHRDSLSNIPTPSFINHTNQIAMVDDVIITHSIDINLALDFFDTDNPIEIYKNIPIYNYKPKQLFISDYKPFTNLNDTNFFVVFDNFLLFATTKEALTLVIKDLVNGNTLSKNNAFVELNDSLSDESSIFIYKNEKTLSKLLNAPLSNYRANAVQFIIEDNYAYINGSIKRHQRKKSSRHVSEFFSTEIEADIISPPQLVKNHLTTSYDIIVQDVNNQVYLISNLGNVLWKKQLQRKILGNVNQIDFFKNKKLQLAFATENSLHIIDRNGKDVKPFPKTFKNPVTQPLSVFDYDQKKDYRLLVTQGKYLNMYNTRGALVRGFTYKNNGYKISSQPKHFKIINKDYIVFSAGKTLIILNRRGKNRIHVREKIAFSNNPIFLYQNNFTTTNTSGDLVKVNIKGQLKKESLQLTNKHYIDATSKTIATLVNNKLQIKSERINLNYGSYTPPRICYVNDKIYITTTDLQAKKVYVFDSQAKPISNFPVYGTSAASLQNFDKDSSLELITQNNSKSVLVYKIN